jgi:hypothetical protein
VATCQPVHGYLARAFDPLMHDARLVALVEAVGDGDDIEDDDGSVVLASIRSDPGNVSLNTMLTEISKLEGGQRWSRRATPSSPR